MTLPLCDVEMRRVPVVDGQRDEAHAFLALCGRPVERDGLCSFHARQAEIDPGELSRWKAALRAVGRRV